MRCVRLTQSRRHRAEQHPDVARRGGNLRCEPVHLLRLRQGKHPAPRRPTCRRSWLRRRTRVRGRRPRLWPWVCGTRMRTWLRRWRLSRLWPWLWWLRRLRWLLLVDRGRQGLLEARRRSARVYSPSPERRRQRGRVCRGSDPRHLRLTMDGLLDQHMWGATPCIKDHPRRKVRPTQHKAGEQIEEHFMGKLGQPSYPL
jgi:hypothetical protein